MKFFGSVAVTNGGTNPDPITSPATVPAANLVGHDGHGPVRDRTVTQRLLLSFDGGAPGETTTVSLYGLDDATNLAGGAAADRKFYLIQAGIALTHRTLTAITGPVPHAGPFYVRQTAGAADGTVKMAAQDG